MSHEHSIAFAFMLHIALLQSEAGRAQLAYPAAASSRAVELAAPCPIPAWQGRCRPLSENERRRVRDAVQAYALIKPKKCAQARDALLSWLGEDGQVWRFDAHATDREEGTYVFAQTAHFAGTSTPAGLGFRSAVLVGPSTELARIALHEGAHLAGELEEGARQVESACLVINP